MHHSQKRLCDQRNLPEANWGLIYGIKVVVNCVLGTDKADRNFRAWDTQNWRSEPAWLQISQCLIGHGA
jgi:hypothetical protein